MIRERIKAETLAAHKHLEQISHSSKIMDGSLDLKSYQNLILSNYISNLSFENTWNSLPFNVPESLILAQRTKKTMLEKDIELLNIEKPEVPQLFHFDDYSSFMGALYVFEGSTLGGSVICKKLKENPHLRHLDFHFYASYGERLGIMWKLFLDHLIQIDDPQEVNTCIASANKTFNIVEQVTVNVG